MAKWEGLNQFCRQSLGVGAGVLLSAFELDRQDPTAPVIAELFNSRLARRRRRVRKGTVNPTETQNSGDLDSA